MYARAALAAMPSARELDSIPGNGGPIPAHQYEQHPARAKPNALAAYNKLCGFPSGKHLPATYPHLLAFPLHLMLMTDGQFPYPPVGLVHIENRIDQRRPIPADEELHIAVHARTAEPHPHGDTFTLITQVRVSGESLWESTSTMLHRGRRSKRGGGQDDGRNKPVAGAPASPAACREDWAAGEAWALPRNLGRRYARVSRDRNPIHTIRLAALALGYRGPIAHGMWTKAHALAALGPQPDSHSIEVSFRKPIVLPATVKLTHREDGEETEFAVRDTAKPISHLRGRVWQPTLQAGFAASGQARA
jgi:acyl dehydratase